MGQANQQVTQVQTFHGGEFQWAWPQCENKITILNVYIPYGCIQNGNSRLAFVISYIQGNPFTCSYVVGDLNANVSDDSSYVW